LSGPRYDRFVRTLFGDALLGALDYWRFPDKRISWGGPFNGQQARRALFARLMEQFNPCAIVETGTFRGMTTEFMAAAGLPVFTVENNRRLYGFSRMRLYGRRNVKVRLGDSRTVLRDLFADPLREFKGGVLFVYLDAHWQDDIPLAEELEIVFRHSPAAIVMIDDFQVPFDDGYGYDKYEKYGPGKALTLNHIARAVEDHGLVVLYPSTPSSEDTGARRGCAIVAIDARHGARLRDMGMLRSA
jgi:hypothetical protein